MKLKSQRAWFLFAGCCMMGLIYVGLICNTAGLYFQDMAQDLALPMAQISMTMSFLNAGGLLGMFCVGRLLEKVNIRVLLSTCVIAVGGGICLGASSHQLAVFCLLWAVIGFCAPLLISIVIPTLLGNWFQKKLGLVTGIVYGLSGIGGAVFNSIIGRMIDSFGWRWAFRFEGVIALITLLPFTLFVFRLKPGKGECSYGSDPEAEEKNGEKSEDIGSKVKVSADNGMTAKTARTCSSYYLFITANIALAVAASLLQQVSPHIQNLGYNITVSSAIMSAVMIGCAAGNVLMGWLLDRICPWNVIRMYTVFGILGWLGMAFLQKKEMLMICGVLLGLGHAVFQVGIPFCIRSVFGKMEYSRIYAGICRSASAIAIFTAALGGIIFDLTDSYVPVMILLCGMYLVGGPCIMKALKKEVIS